MINVQFSSPRMSLARKPGASIGRLTKRLDTAANGSMLGLYWGNNMGIMGKENGHLYGKIGYILRLSQQRSSAMSVNHLLVRFVKKKPSCDKASAR